jgi:hypothetical protein
MFGWYSAVLLSLGSCFASLGEVKYFEASEMTKEIFDALLMDGDVAVIRGASMFWPLANWTCSDFRTNPHMKGFKVERVYGANDGSYVPLCSGCEEWEKDERPSLNDDIEGPSLAPIYWDVKGDPASIDVIDALTPPWDFLSKGNHYWKRNAVELWFSPPNAGAKYHIDGHVQMTAVSQLVGTRRWRLALVPNEPKPGLSPNHLDSHSFNWTADISVTLSTGDLLMFPPGSIHDTLNIGDSCAVSVTHQLGVPYPAKFYRKHLRRLLRIADMRETWPIIADLASLGFLRPKLTLSAPFFEAHSDVASHVDYNESNTISFLQHIYLNFVERQPQPMIGHFGHRRMREYVAFHDANGDGKISASEFIETAIEWLLVETGIMESIPKKFRPLRYFYQDLEEKVSPTYMAELGLWTKADEIRNVTRRHEEL